MIRNMATPLRDDEIARVLGKLDGEPARVIGGRSRG